MNPLYFLGGAVAVVVRLPFTWLGIGLGLEN
jgi:hypothetical protein